MILPGFAMPVMAMSASGPIVMTAGQAGANVGYSDSDTAPIYGGSPIGSVSSPSVGGFLLKALVSFSSGTDIALEGNVVSSAAGKTLYVDEVAYPVAGASGNSYVSSFDVTIISFSSPRPVFVNGVDYVVQIA